MKYLDSFKDSKNIQIDFKELENNIKYVIFIDLIDLGFDIDVKIGNESKFISLLSLCIKKDEKFEYEEVEEYIEVLISYLDDFNLVVRNSVPIRNSRLYNPANFSVINNYIFVINFTHKKNINI